MSSKKLRIVIVMLGTDVLLPVIQEVVHGGSSIVHYGDLVLVCPNFYTNQGNVNVEGSIQLENTEMQKEFSHRKQDRTLYKGS